MRQLLPTIDLILVWTFRTVRARYQQSVLGGLWAVLQPAAAVAVFSVVFTFFVPIDTGGIPYVVFSYTAMVPWTLFAASISDMVESLVANMNLVSKVYFPREVLPIAALLARLLDFAIAAVVVVLLMLYYRVRVPLVGLFFLPPILLVQIALALGVGFLGAALNVFYRDVKHIVTLALQVWFYATPVIYPVAAVPERFRGLYLLNPMTAVVQAYREVLLYQESPGGYLGLAVGTTGAILLLGYWFFKRVEFQFADVV